MRIAFIYIYVGLQCQHVYTNDSSPTSEGPQHGIDFIGPSWLPRTFKVTCCRGGEPVAENVKLIANWTQKASDYAVDERTPDGGNDHCRVFEGTFLLSASALFNFSFTGYGVQCKCPETTDALDKYCRKLAPCQNNGYRSQSLGMLCACTEPFFGEYCDKVCNQGQVLKGVDGRSYCSCLPFYQGERCTEMICMNGGIEIHGRCTCPQSFTGYHCEIDANLTVQHGSRFHRFDESNELFSRDISGTAFSLVMIIVLVVSMYLLMKHRMQVQSRFTASRREEMTRAAALYSITSRRGDVVSPEDLRIVPFVAAGIDRPPPYVLHTYASPVRDEILPPLPSYEDATKTTPIRITQADEFSNSNDATMINVQLDSSVDRDSNRSSTSGVTESRPQIENNNQREAPIISRLVISRKSF